MQNELLATKPRLKFKKYMKIKVTFKQVSSNRFYKGECTLGTGMISDTDQFIQLNNILLHKITLFHCKLKWHLKRVRNKSIDYLIETTDFEIGLKFSTIEP